MHARLDAMVFRLPVLDAARQLADVDADVLAAVVLDPDAPWWRRRLAAAGLHRRVPPHRAEELYVLLARGEIDDEVLADVLAGDPGPAEERLRSYLRFRTDLTHPRPSVHLLRARATLDDPGVVAPLVRMAAEDHWTLRDPSNAVLDELGTGRMLAELDAGSPDELIDPAYRADDVRLCGIRMLHLSGGDPSPALADPSRIVARAAHDALAVRAYVPGGPVDRVADRPGPGRLWALAVLYAQGHDITSLPAALAAPRVELPAVPDDVRAAIVREYAPGRRRTDPRWLVEAAFVEPAVVDVEDQLRRAVAALDAAGAQPGEPVDAGTMHDQGEGTYHRITTASGPVFVSTLGPFVQARDAGLAGTLRAAGFRHVDDELGAVVVDGLCVYFFGHTDPLPVRDLLFYWQD